MTLKPKKTQQMLNIAMDGLSVLVEHENNALEDLRCSLRERWVIATKARGIGELLRHQIDLLPDTQARLRRNHKVRRQLLAGWTRDVRSSFKSKPRLAA